MPPPGHHYQDVRIYPGAKAILGNTYNIQVTASLAFDIYKTCLSTSYFRTLAYDVASFRSLLDFTVEKVETSNPRHKDIEHITQTIDGCFECLQEIETSISEFNKLPTASQRTWERIEDGAAKIIHLRMRLGTSIGLLSALNIQLASSSQEAVRMMLYKFIDEVRTGRREDSVISTNSLSHEEQDSWRIVGKELEDVGITPQLFIENFGWIKETLQYSRESGALQEQPLATQQFSSEAESTEVISADYSIQEGTTVNDLSILSHEYPLTRKPISKTRNQNTAALVQQPSSHHSSASMPHTSDGNNSNNRTGLLSNRNLGEHLQQPMVYSFDCLFPGCSNNRGRGYVDSFNASRHNQRVHSGQRFSCTIFGCGNNYGKGFSCLLSRSRHIELVHSDTNTTSDTTQNAIAENHPSPDLKLQHGSLLSIRQKEVLNSTYENDRQLLNPKTSLSTDPQPHGSPKSSLTLSDQGSCLVQFGVVIEANSHLIDPALSELQNGSQALSFSNPDSFCQTMKEVGRSELTMDKALLSNVADNDMLSETCTSHQTKEDCEWFYCPREDCPRSKGGIGFTKSGYLAKHRPVHESRRYACPFCHSSDDPHLYPRRDSLRRHLRNSHRDKNNSQIQEALAFRMPPVELIISADGERNIDLVPQVTGENHYA